MQAVGAEECHMAADPGPCIGDAVLSFQVNLRVPEGAPRVLDEQVVGLVRFARPC